MAEESEPYYGEDGQPEMYDPEVIENVEFHYFSDYKKKKLPVLKKLSSTFL